MFLTVQIPLVLGREAVRGIFPPTLWACKGMSRGEFYLSNPKYIHNEDVRKFYVFFWVIPWCLNFICRRFGTLCPIFIGYQPMKMEQTACSETSAYKIQTPGIYPKENITYRTRRKFEIKIFHFEI